MTVRNHRKFSRSEVNVTALLTMSGESEVNDVEVIDVSMSGMFIGTSMRPELAARCHVSILLGHFKHELPIEAEAQVVRVTDAGVALRFTQLYLDRLPALKSLIVDHSENPEEAKVEFTRSGGWVFTP